MKLNNTYRSKSATPVPVTKSVENTMTKVVIVPHGSGNLESGIVSLNNNNEPGNGNLESGNENLNTHNVFGKGNLESGIVNFNDNIVPGNGNLEYGLINDNTNNVPGAICRIASLPELTLPIEFTKIQKSNSSPIVNTFSMTSQIVDPKAEAAMQPSYSHLFSGRHLNTMIKVSTTTDLSQVDHQAIAPRLIYVKPV